MGHRFDQRHAVFRAVDLALEQGQEAIGGGLRLAQVIEQLKARFPTQANATVLALPDTSYDALIQVMDAVRERPVPPSGMGEAVPLFPDISIGDAPLAKKT